MRKSSQVTQSKIAKLLGISTVTVSKALRNHPDISPETIQRVKRLANELGYTPDLIARALSSRRSNIIGVVLPEIDHTFFAGVMKGIYSVAEENHYQIVLTVSREDDQREVENLQTLAAMRVDGILISISQKTQDVQIFRKIRERKIPVVFFDRIPDDNGFSSVVVNDREAAFQAVQYALDQGFTRIVHLGGLQHISIARDRAAGYWDALHAAGMKENDGCVIPCGFSEEDGYLAFKQMMQTQPRADAVFTVNDPVAIGVYDAAKETGLRIPEDIGVIGFSDNIISRYLSPPLTTISQPAQEIGRRSVLLLLEALQRPDRQSPRQEVVPARLIVRESCLSKKRMETTGS
ncbi:LacI family DNA-binding transcriptional regulator [bacterium]|nr:LacI family DNA-binding transcriptional regulator [bacterium]